MEINLEIINEDFDHDGTRAADELRRKIFEMFPEGIWERNGNGHKILI